MVKVAVKEMEGVAGSPDANQNVFSRSVPGYTSPPPELAAERPGDQQPRRGWGTNSPARGRGNPLPEIGTIDYFPSIDLVAANQVSNSAPRL